jgi:hypothetical protein
MPNNIYLVPDNVYSASVKLYLDLDAGRITEEEYEEQVERIIRANKDNIAVIKNVGPVEGVDK